MSIVETVSGSVTTTRQFVGTEERDASGLVTKLFFYDGQMNGPTKYFYTFDHLGSVREMTNTGASIQSQYQYGMTGQIARISGVLDSDFQYCGYYAHQPSNLFLTNSRAYNANFARFISRDPISEAGGINLYNYVENDPVSFSDPSGLKMLRGGVSVSRFLPPIPIPPGGPYKCNGRPSDQSGKNDPPRIPPPTSGDGDNPGVSPNGTPYPPGPDRGNLANTMFRLATAAAMFGFGFGRRGNGLGIDGSLIVSGRRAIADISSMVRQNGFAPGNWFSQLNALKGAAASAGATTLEVNATDVINQQLLEILLSDRYNGVVTGIGELGGVNVRIILKL